MSEKLNNLKTALQDYLLEIFTTSRQDVDAYLNLNRRDVERLVIDFIEQGVTASSGHQITDQRAIKLKKNLDVSSLNEFSYKYELRKRCIDFIVTKATANSDLIFDLIVLPDGVRGDKKITFAMSFSDDPEKYYLVFDRDHFQDISLDFQTYKSNFKSTYKDIFDRGVSGNIFSRDENTKRIVVSYDPYFQSLCRTAVDATETTTLLSFNTGLVSFDLEDILRGESRLSFFNMGQFTLYYSLERGVGVAAVAQYGDVFPTYPPLKES
jgi:hypothetical protein